MRWPHAALDVVGGPLGNGLAREFVGDLGEAADPVAGEQFEHADLHAREAAHVHEGAR